jgi:1-acyl-sn-glycerol-3-phosphate acyltransferase
MLYFLGKPLFWLYYHIFFRLKIINRGAVPAKGGVVLCANHISANDALVLGVANKRQIHFLAKKEVFKYKVFVPVLRALHGIPIDRGNPEMSVIKSVIKSLTDGNVLGIFAQGGRRETLDIDSAKSGAAFFALKAGVPVVPVKIESTYRFFSRITVTFGEAVYMDEYKGMKIKTELLEEVTHKLLTAVKSL